MRRTLVQRVGQESVSLQALVPWCSSCNGLVGRIGMCTGEASYFRYHKRLGVIAKLATSYYIMAFLGAREGRGQAVYHCAPYRCGGAPGLCSAWFLAMLSGNTGKD